MTAPTPDTIRTATETLTHLTEYLRDDPDPVTAFALVEPLLDEYTGLPIQFADILRAFARTVASNLDTPSLAKARESIAELRDAAWEQTDQHTLHYALDDLRALYTSATAIEPGCSRCR